MIDTFLNSIIKTYQISNPTPHRRYRKWFLKWLKTKSEKHIFYPCSQDLLELTSEIMTEGENFAFLIGDKNSKDVSRRIGKDILSIDQILESFGPDYDLVIYHQFYEDQIENELIERGFPKERIIKAYSELKSERHYRNYLSDTIPSEIDKIICAVPNGASIIPPEILADIFAPQNTLVLVQHENNKKIYEDLGYSCEDTLEKYDFIKACIDIIEPKNIHFIGTIETTDLAFAISILDSKIKFSYEAIDIWSIPFIPEDIYHYGAAIYNYDEQTTHTKLQAEKLLFEQDNHIIGKQIPVHAPLKDKFERNQYLTIATNVWTPVKKSRDKHKTVPKKNKFAYAAHTPGRSLVKDLPSLEKGYGLWDWLGMVAAETDMEAHFYNASDANLDPNDQTFDLVKSQVAEDKIIYHPRLAQDKLVATLKDYTFGWQVTRYTPAPKGAEIVIPATIGTYLAAGLPVIVAAETKLAASLVEEFQAGIVIKNNAISTAIKEIQQADISKLREGAQNLYLHLFNRNHEALKKLKRALGEQE